MPTDSRAEVATFEYQMGNRRQVLIVDDDGVARRMLRNTLLHGETSRYLVAEAGTVAEALQCLQTRTPDCILLDYILPGENGLKLLEHLQARMYDQPVAVILITGHGDASVAAAAMRGGALDLLAKDGLTPQTLRHAVDNAMEKVAMRRQLVSQRQQLETKNRELEDARGRLENQNQQLVANQRALLNIMDDLEAEINRRRKAEQVS